MASEDLKILIVEDNENDIELAVQEIRRSGFRFDSRVAQTRVSFLTELEKFQPDLILADYVLPQFSGLEALELAKIIAPSVPVIIFTGSINEETAVKCMKAGASDYVIKEHIARLGSSLQSALRKKRIQEEKTAAEKALHESEMRYRTLFESFQEAVFLIRGEKVIECNEKALVMFNCAKEDFFDTNPLLLAPEYQPDNRVTIERTKEVFRAAKTAGSLFFKWQHSRCDGAQFHSEIFLKRVRIGDDVYIQMIVNDVTERRNAEEALRRYGERLRNLGSIYRDIIRAITPEDIAKAAIHHIQELIHCDIASVTVFDNEKGEATVVSIHKDKTRIIETEIQRASKIIQSFGETLPVDAQIIVDLSQYKTLPPILSSLKSKGMLSCLKIPIFVRDKVVLLMLLAASSAKAFMQEHLDIGNEVAHQLAISIENAYLFRSVREYSQNLKALTAKLAEAEELERRRIARELHDTIGQNLSALSLNLNIARNQSSTQSSDLCSSRIDDSLKIVESTAECVRSIMGELRPPVLDDYGFVAAVKWYVKKYYALTNIRVTVQGDALNPRLAPFEEIALFRTVQEALTNVVKHAKATRVEIAIVENDNIIRVSIADDGIGFLYPAVFRNDAKSGWGLLTMKERIEAIGGHFQIDSKPGKGTNVTIEIGKRSQ